MAPRGLIVRRGVIAASQAAGGPPPAETAYNSAVTSDLPGAYLKLSETSGTTAADATGNSRTGTYVGGVTLNQTGLITSETEKAVTLDGVDNHITWAPAVSQVQGPFTLSLLCAPSSSAATSTVFGIYAADGTARLQVNAYTGGSAQFVLVVGGVSLAGPTFTAGTTHHIAVTVSSSNAVSWWIDGVARGTHSQAAPARTVTDLLALGTDWDAGTVVGSYNAAVAADSPSGYLKLSDAPGSTIAADASGNNRTGVYSGSPTLGATGLLTGETETAMQCDGTNDYVVWDAAMSQMLGAFSVDTVCSAGIATAKRNLFGIWGADYTNRLQVQQEVPSPGSYRFDLLISNGTQMVVLQGPAITLGTRYHVAIACNSSNQVAFYVNGTLVGTHGTTLITRQADDRFALGQDWDPGAVASDFWTGKIEKAAVYAAALNTTQIQTHATAAAATQSDGTSATASDFYVGKLEKAALFPSVLSAPRIEAQNTAAGIVISPPSGRAVQEVGAVGEGVSGYSQATLKSVLGIWADRSAAIGISASQSSIDQLILNSAAQGIYVTILIQSPYPSQIGGTITNYPHKQAMIDNLVMAVTRWGEGASWLATNGIADFYVRGFEFGNEIYGDWFWNQLNPAEHALWFRDAVIAARAANSQAQIGLSIDPMNGTTGDYWNGSQWRPMIPDMVAAVPNLFHTTVEGARLADAAIFHQYGTQSLLVSQYNQLVSLMASQGGDDGSLPIWMTEFNRSDQASANLAQGTAGNAGQGDEQGFIDAMAPFVSFIAARPRIEAAHIFKVRGFGDPAHNMLGFYDAAGTLRTARATAYKNALASSGIAH